MIITYFKTNTELLEEIDILKTKLLINKNLVGRFEDCYENKKTIPTKTTRKFIKNLKSQLR